MSDSVFYATLGAGATLVGLYFYGKRKRHEVSYRTLPDTPLLHKGEDICIWCGKEFPEPEFFNEYDPIYQKAMEPWVMLSFGTDAMPVMACEALHMELWYMTGARDA